MILGKHARIESIDFIKGICIFLVVWAHSIQNMGSDNDFWYNPIYIFICSFHMPIFMVMSGFFFDRSASSNLFKLTKKKFRQLIIPCFGWSIILLILTTCYIYNEGKPIYITERIQTLLYETATRFWFLRSVFICYIAVSVSILIFRKDYLACVISIILMLLLPDMFRISLDKFMYPFFWMGYFLHKNIEWVTLNRRKIMILSSIFFIVLLLNWKKEYYIYITGMSFYDIKDQSILFFDFIPRFEIISYRYLIGVLGSISIFLMLQSIYIPQLKRINNVGKYTLGIYVIHLFFEGNILKLLDLSRINFLLYNLVITPIISIILIQICIFIIKLIQRNKFFNTLFLGAPYK
ncbi:acyltransferase family protein [Bacteroides ihuae]|uniref:acyltransferase family protein n=1 Tax=Bacteroides ihuae TaxID=1852362 RepID=UPI0008DB00EB